MGSVSRESIGTLHEKLIFTVAKEDYVPAFEKSLKEYSKKANIPGFRAGMVPMGLVKKMFGHSLMQDQILKTGQKMLEDFMKNEKLSILMQPLPLPDYEQEPLEVNNPREFRFLFEIGLKPSFEIPALINKAPVTKYIIAVTDTLLDKTVADLQKKQGDAVFTETVTPNTTDIEYNLTPIEGAQEVAVAKQNDTDADSEDTEAPMNDSVPLSQLPARLKEKLMELKEGESFMLTPSAICTDEELPLFLNEFSVAEDAKDKEFSFTFMGATEYVPHEINEALYNAIFPNEEIVDETAFRERIHGILVKEHGRVSNKKLHDDIYETLVHTTPFDLPVAFLKRVLKVGNKDAIKTDEQVEKEYGPFEHGMRWQLIFDKIVTENGISISQNELKDFVKLTTLEQFGIQHLEDSPFLDSYIDKIMKDKSQIEELYFNLLSLKTFHFLESQFTVVEQEIDEKDFINLPDAHAHHHH